MGMSLGILLMLPHNLERANHLGRFRVRLSA